MKKVLLFNQRYPFHKDQVYLPSALIAVGAWLIEAGFEVEMIDLNIASLDKEWVRDKVRTADFICTSLTGGSNIPETVPWVKQIQDINACAKVLIGGQVIEGLLLSEFETIFGDSVCQITNEASLRAVLELAKLPDIFSISFVKMYEAIGDSLLERYLRSEMPNESREGGYFSGQGCHFRCDFCAAAKGMSERYRSFQAMREDFLYLTAKAKQFGLTSLRFYISNLDCFQNPIPFIEFLKTVRMVIEETGIIVHIRALTCLTSFVNAIEKHQEVAPFLKNFEFFHTVAFGVDGIGKWKEHKKTQNNIRLAFKAIWLCWKLKKKPEILMVFGFPDHNLWNLFASVIYCILMALLFGATARPYVGKICIPRNDHWYRPEFAEYVDFLIHHIIWFKNIDFCCLANPLTHPNRLLRWAINVSFLTIIAALTPFGRNTTFPILPEGGQRPEWRQDLIEWINRKMPFDR